MILSFNSNVDLLTQLSSIYYKSTNDNKELIKKHIKKFSHNLELVNTCYNAIKENPKVLELSRYYVDKNIHDNFKTCLNQYEFLINHTFYKDYLN